MTDKEYVETEQPDRPEATKPGLVSGPAQPVQSVTNREDANVSEEKHEDAVEQAKANSESAQSADENEVKETSSGGGGNDPDSAATGAGPSGGADIGTTGGDTDSSATGAGPSGGA